MGAKTFARLGVGFTLLSAALAAPEDMKITNLPGAPAIGFDQYSGLVEVRFHVAMAR